MKHKLLTAIIHVPYFWGIIQFAFGLGAIGYSLLALHPIWFLDGLRNALVGGAIALVSAKGIINFKRKEKTV
jgi:hypothetical protein